MILHIATDEKFIDSAFSDFETVCPGNNRLIIFSDQNLKYVKTTPYRIFPKSGYTVQQILSSSGKFDLIICYGMFHCSIMISKYVSCPVVWLGYGFDYCNLINKNKNNSLQLQTLQLVKNKGIKSLKTVVKTILTSIIPYHIYSYLFSTNEFKLIKLIREGKISFFAPVIKPEYDLLKQSIKTKEFPHYIDFSFGTGYPSNEDFYSSIRITGNDILLGNSAFPTNNHIEAIDIIAKYIPDTKINIITPLSYGEDYYRKAIISYGKSILGSRFLPLVDFMSSKDYFTKISSCSVAIMNHLRQQALSNITIMLLIGAKVFLNEQNILYGYLKDAGFRVFSINDIKSLGTESLKQLSEDDCEKNRYLVHKLWSKEAILSKIKNLTHQVSDLQRRQDAHN